MARPLKAGMDYFTHDTDASNDEKIEAIRALHGNDGYAFYFILCERIYRTPDAELDVSKKAIEASIIKKVGVTPEKFKDMLETAFEVELFCKEAYEDRQVLTSKGIKKRAKEVQALRERWRKQKEFPAENPRENPRENPAENGEENAEETPERKEKKRKDKDRSSSSNNNPPARTEIFTAFEKEFGRLLSPMEIEQLKGWEQEHSQELILEALKRAALGGNHTFKYINGILLRWAKNNIRTIREVERHEADFQARKAGPARIRGAPAIIPNQMDKLEEWAKGDS